MALPLANTAESGLADGTAVTTGNSGGGAGDAWDGVTSGGANTVTFVTSPTLLDTLAYKMFISAASQFANVNWFGAIGGAFTDLYGRIYFQFPTATPAGRCQMIAVNTSGVSNNVQVSLENAGHIRVWDALFASTEGTFVCLADTLYRLEWHYVASTTVGSIEARLYAGNSTSTLDTVLRSGVNTAASSDQVALGGTSGEEAAAFTLFLDDAALATGGWIGPAVPPPPPVPGPPLVTVQGPRW